VKKIPPSTNYLLKLAPRISSLMLLQMAAQEAPHSSCNAPPRLLTAAPKTSSRTAH